MPRTRFLRNNPQFGAGLDQKHNILLIFVKLHNSNIRRHSSLLQKSPSVVS